MNEKRIKKILHDINNKKAETKEDVDTVRKSTRNGCCCHCLQHHWRNIWSGSKLHGLLHEVEGVREVAAGFVVW